MEEETYMNTKKFLFQHKQALIDDDNDSVASAKEDLLNQIKDKNRKNKIDHSKFDKMYTWHMNNKFLKRQNSQSQKYTQDAIMKLDL